ncbi:mediator of RNA polymerase II transcription subunit 9 [Lepeophtheirus salmonis]|uniref:Mediator of RNA polymerase II transcription subunit 9 n=1 Tax=Lepeophtheirus salmonis TaxID=72036 RepID=D3PG45_LEPSM|nr:mediator of RNA polymerase II transcription subunit 9-like [Lepeophtheirus salmonis]ADD24241.1 Mediator of RNA polymerase II transcription subunit 9 [Lepeophtheirus salmonis]
MTSSANTSMNSSTALKETTGTVLSTANIKEDPEKTLIELADLLPSIYDILRASERDDTNKDPAEASQRVIDLNSRIEKLKERVKSIDGIAYTKEEQLEHLKSLKEQLVLKKALITKYKTLNLEISGLSGV